MATRRDSAPPAIKIVVAGGGGPVTTLLAAACELPPLTTTVLTTTASAPTPASAATTTVADFGRTVVTSGHTERLVYLFGVRGGGWPPVVWDEVCRATTGLLILVDPDEPADAGQALDHAIRHDLPYLIVTWPGGRLPAPADLRDALALPPYAPLVVCEPGNRHEVHTVLGVLVDHALRFPPKKGSPCSHDHACASISSPAGSASASPGSWR